MTQIATDLRNTIEEARRIRYEPVLATTATDVQGAIDQAGAAAAAAVIAAAAAVAATKITPTSINFAASPYTVTNADTYILVNTSGGSVTINLQASAARAGLGLVVKDDTGNAAANPIALVANGAETVDGLASYPIDSNFGAVRLGPQTGGYFAA